MSSPDADLSRLTVVVTRARSQAGSLVELLEAKKARVIELPVIELVRLEDQSKLDEALHHLDAYAAMILGSKNAAEVLFERTAALKISLNLPIACVGAKTLAFAARNGATTAFAPAEFRAEAMVIEIEKRLGSLAKKRFLFPRTPEGRELIIETLEAKGAQVDALPVYRIRAAPQPAPEKLHELDAADVYTFLSGETLRVFLELIPNARERLERAKVAVIGPVAAEKAGALSVRVDVVPPAATIEALVEALASC